MALLAAMPVSEKSATGLLILHANECANDYVLVVGKARVSPVNEAESRRKLRLDIETGAFLPYISIHDYCKYADAEALKWVGLKSWDECRGAAHRAPLEFFTRGF